MKNRIKKVIRNTVIAIVTVSVVLLVVLGAAYKEKKTMEYYNLKKVTWYGDSITKMYTYCSVVDDYFKFVGHNSGINGTLITNVNYDSMCNKTRMLDIGNNGEQDESAIAGDSEIIFVMGGVNDWNHNIVLGDAATSFEKAKNGEYDEETFAGACNLMFANLKELYPDARIIVLGTPFASGKGYDLFPETDGIYNELGLTSVEYGDVLCKVAQMWDIENMNIGRVLGWDESNIFEYSPDGMHFGEDTGGVAAGNEIIKFLKALRIW